MRQKGISPTTNVGDILVTEAKIAAEHQSSIWPTSHQMWTQMWKLKVAPKMKDFLWKLIHNCIRCSTFFARIPTLTNRQYCHCGAVETIEHIFFECDNSCQSQIWPFAELLWNKMSKIKWVTPNLNLIKAIGCICISDAQGNYKTHTTSIYQTIVMVTIWHIMIPY